MYSTKMQVHFTVHAPAFELADEILGLIQPAQNKDDTLKCPFPHLQPCKAPGAAEWNV